MFLKMRASTGATWNFPRDFNDVITVPSVPIGIIRHAPLLVIVNTPSVSPLNYIVNVSIVNNYLAPASELVSLIAAFRAVAILPPVLPEPEHPLSEPPP